RMGRFTEASEIALNVLPIAKRNNIVSEYESLLNSLAISYTFQAKYDQALKIHFQALTLREAKTDKDYVGISNSLNNIGLVYFKLKNYTKALEYYDRALALKEETDNNDLERILI